MIEGPGGRFALDIALCLCFSVYACSEGTPAPVPAEDVGFETEDPAQPRYSAEVEARIAAVLNGLPGGGLQGRMRQYGVPGVSVAVVNAGAVEWARGYGVREAGAAAAVNVETLFQAASISKSLTAMAVLSLAGAGVDLGRDVNDQLVSWRLPDTAFAATSRVSPSLLLSHTGGINVHGFGGYLPGSRLPTLLEILDGRAPANSEPIRVVATPGTSWRYSGGGYEILHQLTEDVSRQPFADLMQARVLGPLGMTHSTFVQPLPPALSVHAATGHRAGPARLEGGGSPRWHVYPELAAAGLWTTPSDLAVFVAEIARAHAGASARVLSRSVTREMLTPRASGYGYGLEVHPGSDGETVRFGHGGANEGFRAQFVGITRSQVGAVVMTNSDEGGSLATEIITSVARVYGWPVVP